MGSIRISAAALAALSVAGCAIGGTIRDPPTRLTWLNYLNGDDIRSTCKAGAPDRFRLIYNADYNEHVRTYDVTTDDAGGATVEARVIEADDLAQVDLSDPQAPWRGTAAQVRLSPDQVGMLVAQLAEAGAFAPVPGSLRLVPSTGIYWLVNGCRAGAWFLSAYPYPPDRFIDIRFGRADSARR